MRKVTKGKLGDFVFPLNPTTLKYDGGVEWQPINSPGMSNPIWQSGNAKPHKISFDLWVTKKIETYVDVAQCLSYLRKYRGSREPIIFAYGEHYVNKVVVSDLNITGETYDNQLRIIEFKANIVLNVVF
ncbi:hypothetical protein EBX93_16815 [bacterium]|nr:hypothetical protein [bacterium]